MRNELVTVGVVAAPLVDEDRKVRRVVITAYDGDDAAGTNRNTDTVFIGDSLTQSTGLNAGDSVALYPSTLCQIYALSPSAGQRVALLIED